MRAINLLPRDDARRGRPQKTQWIVLVPVVLAVLLAAVLSAMFLSASGTVKDKQAELATLQDELHAIPTPDASRVKTQTALAADKQARVTALSGALSRRVAWDRVFRELSLVLPNDVWLATISAKAPVPSSTAAAPAPVAAGGHDRSDRVHARRLHLLASGGRAAAEPAGGRPRPRQRAAPAEHADQGRQRPGRPLRDRRRRAAAGSRAVKTRPLAARPDRADRGSASSCSPAAGGSLLIRPQHAKAADLDHQIADTNSAIDAARALTLEAKKGAQIRVADLYRLTKAMPDQVDMAGILLELNQVAEDSGITFELITPVVDRDPDLRVPRDPDHRRVPGQLLRPLGLPLPDPEPRRRAPRHARRDRPPLRDRRGRLRRGASASGLPADPGASRDRRVRLRHRHRADVAPPAGTTGATGATGATGRPRRPPRPAAPAASASAAPAGT